MSFDPDKYLAEKAGSAVPQPTETDNGFDPDAYLASKGVPVTTPIETPTEDLSDISKLESFTRAAAQIPTLGFADEISGGAKAAWDVATTDKTTSDLEKLYSTYRDMERRKNKLAAEANPKTSMAGSVAGGLATALVPGLNVASVPGAVGLGAAAGLGSSDADLLKGEYKDAALDTAVGGALGGATQKLTNVVGSGIKGFVQGTKKSAIDASEDAAKSAYSSLNPSTKEMAELQGVIRSGGLETGEPNLPELVKKYTFFKGGPEKTVKEVQKRIDDIEALKAPLFKDAEKGLSNLTTEQINALPKVDLKSQFNELADEVALAQNNLGPEEKVALAEQIRGMFDNYTNPLASLVKQEGKFVTAPKNTNNLVELDAIKKEFGKDLSKTGFDMADKIAEGLSTPQNKAMLEAKRKAYDIVKNHITDVGNAIGGNTGTTIKNLNKEESLLIGLRDTAIKASALNEKSGGLGIGGGMAMNIGAGTIGAGAGAVLGPVGATLGAGAGLLAKKSIEDSLGQGIDKAAKVGMSKYKQSSANILNKFGKQLESAEPAIQKAGQFVQDLADEGMVSGVAQKSPFRTKSDTSNLATYDDNQLSGVAGALSSSEDSQLKNYGENLNKALNSKDPQSKNAAVFLIMQNPKARQALGLRKSNK